MLICSDVSYVTSPVDGGSSLLKHPSKAMQRLLKCSEPQRGSGDQQGQGGKRPVLSFVMQKHDLDSLQIAMRQALRKAMCRVYALQVRVANTN